MFNQAKRNIAADTLLQIADLIEPLDELLLKDTAENLNALAHEVRDNKTININLIHNILDIKDIIS